MFNDVESFLSGTGGDDRMDVWSPSLLIGGMVAESNWFSKRIIKAAKANRNQARNKSEAFTGSKGKLSLHQLRKAEYGPMKHSPKLFKQGNYWDNFWYEDKLLRREIRQDAVKKGIARRLAKPRAQTLRDITKGSFSGTRTLLRTTRMLGAAIAVSQAFAWGAELFTPGVSKAAVKRDNEMFNEGALDSAQAYTQRQRALMAIHDSQMTVRNVIGQEAAYFHR